MKQRTFVCKHCGHVLTMKRSGMTLKEARSWFKYATCPACKREIQVIERVPEPVVPAYAQPPLWTGEAEDGHTTR